MLYCLHLLKQEHRIPGVPVFLNSPMAADATRIYEPHRDQHRLTPAQCDAMGHAAHIVTSVEESKRLNELRMPAVIVSASGMATGGRVLHHLKAFGTDARNAILFAGYQAAGTRGAAIMSGAPTVKIHGQHVPIRAEVAQIDSLSGHADRDELLAWVGALPAAPRRIFVTHGEPVAADALRQAIEERHGWGCSVPEYRDVGEL
jgi:metallo-beta-lactamase family protein